MKDPESEALTAASLAVVVARGVGATPPSDRGGGVRIADVNLEVQAGSLVVISPFEAGLTLLHCISGLTTASGTLLVCGFEVADADATRARTTLADLEAAFDRDATVREILASARIPPTETSLIQLCAQKLGLDDVLDTRWGSLAPGARLRTQLAYAALDAPDLLTLVLPAGQLDPVETEQLSDALLELVDLDGHTVLVATDEQRLIAIADHHAILATPGSPAEAADPPRPGPGDDHAQRRLPDTSTGGARRPHHPKEDL